MVNAASMLLAIRNVTVSFPGFRHHVFRKSADNDRLTAVRNVSLSLGKGVTIGLVGESGCGKTTLGRAVVGLQPVDSGSILFERKELSHLSGTELRTARKRIQMIFQNPFASLNPRITVFDAVAEALETTGGYRRNDFRDRVAFHLEQVGLDGTMMRKFPHEFSGGQRQRIAIARALAAEPAVIIADEPVSSLDVSVAAQILNLLHEIRDRLGLTMLFISHDLSVVRFIAHTIAVMYRGSIVEYGPADTVFSSPLHPYTALLLRSVPVLNAEPGATPFFETVPLRENAAGGSTGCPFASRCEYTQERCRETEPVLLPQGPTPERQCACFRAGEISL
ncbi:MAG: ABC transporter ATP-binding protein [Chitinispirillaceae bacterium]|nr:ABC transporter ATP-binding protein [Chitinispirillaceae bacterium]